MIKRRQTIGIKKTDLEKLAQEMFERYSINEKGKKYNWNYLGASRKALWMKEALTYLEFIIEKSVVFLNKNPERSTDNSSYVVGYIDGLLSERRSLFNFFRELLKNFKEQMDEFENNLEK